MTEMEDIRLREFRQLKKRDPGLKGSSSNTHC